MLKQASRWIVCIVLMLSMTGCFHWIRAYQTYLQMDEFDENFAVSSDDYFTIYFKSPVLYSDDFEALAKISPSDKKTESGGQRWRYRFWKEDGQGRRVHPPVSFYFDLHFNEEDRINHWRFSPLFLQIAPAKFLEWSLRSLGAGEINQDARQLKVDTAKLEKLDADLPLKAAVLKHLGEPFEIHRNGNTSEYSYHFRLDSMHIQDGYEDRALSEMKILFDETTQEMIKMSGRFAGVKLSIRYRNLQKKAHVI